MKHRTKFAAILIILICLASKGWAVPIQWEASSGGNGHYYEWIQKDSLDWNEAKLDAEQTFFNGLQGHLVTITSAEEDTFVQSVFDMGVDRIWFGGYQLNNDDEPLGNWVWVTGERWEYSNFKWYADGTKYADGTYGHADYLQWWRGGWDDNWAFGINPSGEISNGYIIEYESTPVPEPMTLLLFGGGLLGLAGFRRG